MRVWLHGHEYPRNRCEVAGAKSTIDSSRLNSSKAASPRGGGQGEVSRQPPTKRSSARIWNRIGSHRLFRGQMGNPPGDVWNTCNCRLGRSSARGDRLFWKPTRWWMRMYRCSLGYSGFESARGCQQETRHRAIRTLLRTQIPHDRWSEVGRPGSAEQVHSALQAIVHESVTDPGTALMIKMEHFSPCLYRLRPSVARGHARIYLEGAHITDALAP